MKIDIHSQQSMDLFEILLHHVTNTCYCCCNHPLNGCRHVISGKNIDFNEIAAKVNTAFTSCDNFGTKVLFKQMYNVC